MSLRVVGDWGWLQRSQWFDKKRLAEIQTEKLRQIVEHAYRKVPFYRKLYDGTNLDFSNMNLHSFSKLPLVTKQHFRDAALPERTAVDANIARCRTVYTSGSTGIPLMILDDARCVVNEEALNLRSMWAEGVRPFDKVCKVFRTVPPFLSDSNLLTRWVKRRFYRHLPATDSISDQVDLYSTWEPHVLIASPWYYRVLTRFLEENRRSLAFERAMSSGDLLDDETRNRIADGIHADVFDFYGLNEVGGVAWECPTHSGYHINAESLLVEFLHEGEPVAAGEPGEVYVTSFCRAATPIIRYSTGDVATPIDDDCPCGRGLPLIKNIQGRITDFIQMEDGRFMSPHEVTDNLQLAFGVEQFKVIQQSDLSIRVYVKTSQKQVDEIVRDLESRCKHLFGNLPVNLQLVDELENEKGSNFRLVESRLASR
ncbi:MAG TPA: hypothetical protein VEG61_08020 [Candidatus Dormibacteraeota bacterium]|nr:hypothetical protein [Candidatus Dormibacteraeota bacterium]